jgi:uncharacterized cupin superfamily protein
VTVPEASLRRGDHGLEPAGDGWFVLNSADAPWIERPGRGFYSEFEGFEGAADFPQLGINITVLGPGEPIGMYHYENAQEDFLVLAGEAVLLIEGQERPLRRWDFVHCPPRTEHIIIGAADGPCAVLCVGARMPAQEREWGAYTVDEAALRRGVGVEQQTSDAGTAYARFRASSVTGFRPGWLPE